MVLQAPEVYFKGRQTSKNGENEPRGDILLITAILFAAAPLAPSVCLHIYGGFLVPVGKTVISGRAPRPFRVMRTMRQVDHTRRTYGIGKPGEGSFANISSCWQQCSPESTMRRVPRFQCHFWLSIAPGQRLLRTHRALWRLARCVRAGVVLLTLTNHCDHLQVAPRP